MARTIYFDMDGTIADLYSVDGWLDHILAESAYPYAQAKPLVRLSTLAFWLNKLQKKGYRLGVISWCAKGSTQFYDALVMQAKQKWLQKHLPSVHWDEINIVPYGFCKNNFCNGNDVLFDDEERNRTAWTGNAYDVNNILEVLKTYG